MKRSHATLSLAIAALGVELSGTEPPHDLRLIPAGEFRAVDGRPTGCAAWVCTDEDGARLVADAATRASARVIDYEHATLHAKKTGVKAPAAGWFTALEWRPGDGLWAVGVDWTAAAAQSIVSKEYRYLSPVFSYDAKSGRVQKLFHAALTNDPGLDGLTDLAALAADLFSARDTDAGGAGDILPPLNPLENSMPELLKNLLAALGLQESATEAEALAAVDSLKTNVAALTSRVVAPDPALFVPVATLSALQGENATLQGKLTALTAEVEGGRLDKIIVDGLAAGKLTPATESWARGLGKKDVAALTAFIDAAPVVVAPGATQTGGRKPAGGVDAGDAHAVADLARQYQADQAAQGIVISTVQAVSHVIKQGV